MVTFGNSPSPSSAPQGTSTPACERHLEQLGVIHGQLLERNMELSRIVERFFGPNPPEAISGTKDVGEVQHGLITRLASLV
jgi:hypothetical protein